MGVSPHIAVPPMHAQSTKIKPVGLEKDMSGRQIANAVGNFSSVLGIGSFFIDIFAIADDNATDEQMFARLDEISNSLDVLNSIASGGIKDNIAQSLGNARTAQNRLETYTNAGSQSVREDAARDAVNFADQALNAVVLQSRSLLSDVNEGARQFAPSSTNDLSLLTYAFGAVQYAMQVRQAVANVVQDGPVGAPGLHQQIQEAAVLLYDQENGSPSLISAMEREIANGIVDQTFDTNGLAHGGINVLYRSAITDNFSSRTPVLEYLIVGIIPDFVKYDAEIAEQRPLRIAQVFRDDMAELGINDLKAAAIRANDFLWDASPSLFEQYLSDEGEVTEGTSRADFIQGGNGDDVISGDNEAVTGQPGGPDALVGGAGNDILRGDGFADNLTGGAGNDFIIGGTNIGDALENDTARFEGEASDYQIIGGTTYAIVIGPDGSRDKVFDVQFLRFDDGLIALGAGSALDGMGDPEDFITAEIIALLYEAALNRNDGEGLDRSGFNFYIDVAANLQSQLGFDRDEMIEFIAEDLMTSPEFEANFGAPETLTAGQFVDQIYNNVLGRPAEDRGRDFYISELTQNGRSQAEVLADIAISPENTLGSAETLMSLFETTTPETHPTTGIVLDWYFIA